MTYNSIEKKDVFDETVFWRYRERVTGLNERGKLINTVINRWEYKLMNCQKILDAGFGRGDFMEECPEGTDIWGVDIDSYAVKYFNQRGYKVVYTSVLHLPFPENFFDGTHCANLIAHLNGCEVRTMLHEFSRVMKPGGRLLITTPRKERIWHDPYSIRPYSLQAIKRLLEDTQFGFIDSHSLGRFWGMGLLSSINPQLSLFLQLLIGRFMGLNLVILAENRKLAQIEEQFLNERYS